MHMDVSRDGGGLKLNDVAVQDLPRLDTNQALHSTTVAEMYEKP